MSGAGRRARGGSGAPRVPVPRPSGRGTDPIYRGVPEFASVPQSEGRGTRPLTPAFFTIPPMNAPVTDAARVFERRDASREGPILVSLSAVVWDFPLVGRTRMLAEAWRTLEVPQVFVQVPSYRTALQKLLAPFRAPEHVPVVRPWPGPPARGWARRSRSQLTDAIRCRARLLRKQLDHRLDWKRAAAIVVTPAWTPWLEELPFAKVIYDCIDDLQVHVPRPELAGLFAGWETELLVRCDAATVTAEHLATSLRRRRPDLPLTIIRNGVDAAWFQEVAASSARPAVLPPADRPIVGFVGALYRWIDWRLIEQVVDEIPEARFVFVGPDDRAAAIASLRTRPNVQFRGARPYAHIPAYIDAFDVCWVPFTQDDISHAANPVKIYEYLALGKPVVSTPVADTQLFEGHVAVGSSPAEITRLLRLALSQCLDPLPRAARRSFAARNTWQARAQQFRDYVSNLFNGR